LATSRAVLVQGVRELWGNGVGPIDRRKVACGLGLVGIGYLWWSRRKWTREECIAAKAYRAGKSGLGFGPDAVVCLQCLGAGELSHVGKGEVFCVPTCRCELHMGSRPWTRIRLPLGAADYTFYGGAKAYDSCSAMLAVEMRSKLSDAFARSIAGPPMAVASVPRVLVALGVLGQRAPSVVYSHRDDDAGCDTVLDSLTGQSLALRGRLHRELLRLRPIFAVGLHVLASGNRHGWEPLGGGHPACPAAVDQDVPSLPAPDDAYSMEVPRPVPSGDGVERHSSGVDGVCLGPGPGVVSGRGAGGVQCGGYVLRGQPVVTYRMGVAPAKYSSRIRLGRRNLLYYKMRDAKTLDKLRRSLQYQACIESGMTVQDAIDASQVPIQCRYLLPVYSNDPFFVADKEAAENEEYAIKVRNFAVQPEPVDWRMLHTLREIATYVAFLMSEVALANGGRWDMLDLNDYFPTAWTTERATRVWLDLAGVDLDSFSGKEGWACTDIFVKGNECLAKMKPRIIQARDDRVALMESILCKMFADALYAPQMFESSSIKHASLHDLADRFRTHLKSFVRGKFISADFVAWESRLNLAKRKATENTGLVEYASRISARCPFVRAALKQRCKEKLHARGKYHWITADDFGRESGDGGTSTLNFFDNICFTVALDMRLASATGGDSTVKTCVDRRVKGTSWLTSIHEGDDTILVYSDALMKKLGPQTVLDETLAHYDELRVEIEPATKGGVSRGVEVLQPFNGRIEFCSRLWDLTARPYSIPMLQKALRSAAVTMAKGAIEEASYLKGISGMYNAVHHPLLYNLFNLLASRGAKTSHLDDKSFKGRALAAWTGSADVEAKLLSLRHSAMACDQRARALVAREHAALTCEKQIAIEEHLEALRSGVEDWDGLGQLLRELIACI
jgi:hypothetical protein